MTADLVLSLPPELCRAYAPTDVIIQEMGFAADLLLRAEQSLSREFDILRAGGVVIDYQATQLLSTQLVRMSAQLTMLALRCVEG